MSPWERHTFKRKGTEERERSPSGKNEMKKIDLQVASSDEHFYVENFPKNYEMYENICDAFIQI